MTCDTRTVACMFAYLRCILLKTPCPLISPGRRRNVGSCWCTLHTIWKHSPNALMSAKSSCMPRWSKRSHTSPPVTKPSPPPTKTMHSPLLGLIAQHPPHRFFAGHRLVWVDVRHTSGPKSPNNIATPNTLPLCKIIAIYLHVGGTTSCDATRTAHPARDPLSSFGSEQNNSAYA